MQGAPTGSGLIERLAEARPDLLLMDTALPEATPADVCESILALRDLDGVRVVLLAGPLETADSSDLPPGVHSIVQKPLDAETLSGLLTDLPPAEAGEQDRPADAGDRVLRALIDEALGQARPAPSRAAIRAQIDAAVSRLRSPLSWIASRTAWWNDSRAHSLRAGRTRPARKRPLAGRSPARNRTASLPLADRPHSSDAPRERGTGGGAGPIRPAQPAAAVR